VNLRRLSNWLGNSLNTRTGPRHPRLAAAGFRAARWLAAKTMGAAGFHQLGWYLDLSRLSDYLRLAEEDLKWIQSGQSPYQEVDDEVATFKL